MEMHDPEEWLLNDDDYDKTLYDLLQTHFPHKWHSSERKLRCDRVARKRLAISAAREEDHRASSEMPDEMEQAEMLLGEALPHLPELLAEQVRQFLEK